MANPQVDKGFIRIAHELWEEILRRDFSKRQTNIILLIWRLSYGCGRKDCIVSKFKSFELAGLYKGDIKKELKYLKECRVIEWDGKSLHFAINKDYEKWQLSPTKNWDEDILKKEIQLNLKDKKVSKILTKPLKVKVKKVSKTLTKKYILVSKTLTKQPQKVSETLTKEGQKVSETLTKKDFQKNGVSKTLTEKLVKHLPQEPAGLRAPRDTAALKKYKEIKDTTTTINIEQQTSDKKITQNCFVFYEQNFGLPSPFILLNIENWVDDFGGQQDIIIYAMQLTLLRNKTNFGYTESILKDWHKRGAKTLAECEALQREFENNKKVVPMAVGGSKRGQTLRKEDFDLND